MTKARTAAAAAATERVDHARLAVPAAPERQPPQRAARLPTYLRRIIPFYATPAWLSGDRWRAVVRSQPIAVACRDTLLANLQALEWRIVPRDPDTRTRADIRRAIAYYEDLLSSIEGDFDTFIDLMGQDLLDLPFGAMAEIGREGDEPDAPVVWIRHVDGATLYPTYRDDFPVAQIVPETGGGPILFPSHSCQRMLMSPRPELMRTGWGMAPPEKAYLAMTMLSQGDRYYWQLLLDTPETGILDLGDMDEESARQWIEGFRSMFEGLDPLKIPVLYAHTSQVKWLPFSRPPTEMLYDKASYHYAQILAAAYGLRTSDIGLEEPGGGGTLAGVIRAERQSKRSGHAVVKERFRNLFDHILPRELRFLWVDTDVEDIVARGRAVLALSQGLVAAIGAGLLDQAEARSELLAQGPFRTELDPTREDISKPEPQPGAAPGGDLLSALLGRPPQAPRTGAGAAREQGMAPDQAPVPPSQGGRGETPKPLGLIGRIFTPRQRGADERPAPRPAAEVPVPADVPADQEGLPSADALRGEMRNLVGAPLQRLTQRATRERLMPLIAAAVEAIVPAASEELRSLSQDEVDRSWLMGYLAAAFESETVPAPVFRQREDEAQEAVEKALQRESWWLLENDWDKRRLVAVLLAAYRRGVMSQALDILRALGEATGEEAPALIGLSFDITDPLVLGILEETAAALVRHVDEGTRYYLRRLITAGVRQGIASDRIAHAIREGAHAADILQDAGFVESVLATIGDALEAMSAYRTESIVNTEIAAAENAGRLEQLRRSGLTRKAWVHLGERGVTEAGNVHPCPICAENEALGFVPLDYMYATVFGPEDSPTPPGHPGVCHCTIFFDEDELRGLVAEGGYTPWTGGVTTGEVAGAGPMAA